MSSSIEQTKIVECPICYDEIDVLKNCVTTECGHQFHCNCLMKNSAQNGFSCPMCRSVLAEKPESDDEDEELSEYEDYEEDEAFDDNALTSFRMFNQQLDGEEVEEEPIQEVEEDQPLVEEPIVKPSPETIAARLVTQGYTMEDLIKCMLIDHEEYEAEAETNERFADRMFGKFRQIISNYPREQQEAEAAAQRQSLPGLVQRHGSSRLRQRAETEDCFAQMHNRYQMLSDNVDNDDDEV
jgi:hypothetical protein